MTYNMNYELGSLPIVIFLYVYLRLKYYNSTDRNKSFRILVFTEFCSLVLDIIGSITIYYSAYVPLWLNYFINTTYFLCAGLMCSQFSIYYASFSPSVKSMKKVKMVIYSWLAFFYIILLINIPTGIIFYFADGAYHLGTYHILALGLPFSFYLFCIGFLIAGLKSMERKTLFILLLLVTISISGAVIETFFFPNVLLGNVTPVFAAIICIFTLISPNYSELVHKKMELSAFKNSLEDKIEEQTQAIIEKMKEERQLADQIIDALAVTIDIAHSDAEGHSSRVADMSRKIGLELGMDEDKVQTLYYMAVVHDIGVIGVPDEVLLEEGVFTPEQREKMNVHPEVGARILECITEIPNIGSAAHWHHERFDGKGFPDGLKGDEIPLEARIVCVADAYDAMTHERPYRPIVVMNQAQVKKEFEACSGSQFDPEIVKVLFKVVGWDFAG